MDEEDAKTHHVADDEKCAPKKIGDVAYSNVFVGYSVVLFGVLILSLDALMIDEVKSRGLDDWAVLFYRYLLSTSTIFVFINQSFRQWSSADTQKVRTNRIYRSVCELFLGRCIDHLYAGD